MFLPSVPHDQFGTRLTELGLIVELEHRKSGGDPVATRTGSELVPIIRSLEQDLDTIVWAVNPRNDTIASLASYFGSYAQRLLDLASVGAKEPWMDRERPIDSRPVDPPTFADPRPRPTPDNLMWFRADGELPEDVAGSDFDKI